MKIKYIRAKNFLSIGKEAIEIDFTKYGNIINVIGKNCDRGENASNGSGKSSILEIIVYGLYGKLIKNMSHKEAINNKSKKGMEVEIHWDDYKVIRTRKPDTLRFWKGDEELTVGGGPTTQVEIIKEIGLGYQAFVNTAFFGQHNQYAFLSCDSQTKREIVENLLSLDKYNTYAKTAKDKRKTIEEKISLKIKEYELLHKSVETDKKRIAQIGEQVKQWKQLREFELNKLNMKHLELTTTLNLMPSVKHDEVKKEIATIDESLKAFKDGKAKLEAGLHDATEKFTNLKETKHQFVLRIATLKNQIEAFELDQEKIKKENARFDRLENGVKCPICLGDVDKKNSAGVVAHNHEKLDELAAGIKSRQEEIKTISQEEEKANENVVRVREAIATGQNKLQMINQRINSLDIKQKELISTLSSNEQVSQALLDNVMNQLAQKKEEIANGDPYRDILLETQSDLMTNEQQAAEIKNYIKTLEEDLPYLDYLIKAFGDNGIRKFVIDDMISPLNARVNYWLQFLIDNKLTLTFNNQLEEVIQSNPPDGDPYVYNGLSGGEHNRIDLAISQAFSYLMILSSGTCPSIVALDEVVSYQDRQGVECIFNMIVELARDRQVIVITHDNDLLQMLEGVDKIVIEKKNGFSRLIEK